ncbi:GGDEF domain-containing protein [Reinekea forsetii]|nr:GGDEF domain-containing protein [Reinekea forsetii]
MLFLMGVVSADPLTNVRVQLKWLHQYQFAGFYAAISQGYFEDAGLNVTLIEGGPSLDPVDEVLAGQAEFGVGNSSLLVAYFEGKPVVMVAAIFQHTPFAILARNKAGINTIKDLEGKTLMGEVHADELMAFLLAQGVDINKINLVPHTGNIRSLIPGSTPEIHASTSYLSTEPFLAVQVGLDYQIFSPNEYGIDYYGDSLFTSRAFADENPETVVAMKQALLKGWQYAAANSEEVISDILENYSTDKTRLALTFEAQTINNLLEDEMLEIGYISQSRLNNIATLFTATGLVTETKDLKPFLFQPAEQAPKWVGYTLLALAAISVVSTVIATRIYHLNQQRIAELNKRKELEILLTEQARTDPLTNLANRRWFEDVGSKSVEQALRHKRSLGVIMIDVDQFKPINDLHGHHFGDQCLRTLSAILLDCIRAGDLAARLGGDEFVLLLPDANEDVADAIRNRLLEQLRNHPIQTNEVEPIILSVSMGIGWLEQIDNGLADVIHRADQDMYANKESN